MNETGRSKDLYGHYGKPTVSVSVWLLFIPLVAAVVLAMLSISFQVAKASKANPVNALKYE